MKFYASVNFGSSCYESNSYSNILLNWRCDVAENGLSEYKNLFPTFK